MQEFNISPEYRISILEELNDDATSNILEGELNFLEAIHAWYDNLMDDLHDSVGDQDYQQGVLERMQVMERAFPGIIEPAKEEDKLSEAPWAR